MGEKKGQSGNNWQYRDLSRLIPLIQEQWAAGRTEEARRLADAALQGFQASDHRAQRRGIQLAAGILDEILQQG